MQWDLYEGPVTAFELLGDNADVVGWINGMARCKEEGYIGWVSSLMAALHRAWQQDAVVPRRKHCGWARHIYREYNKEADSLATQGIMSQCSCLQMYSFPMGAPTALVANFDGGLRDGHAASGWLLKGRWGEAEEWIPIAHASLYIGLETCMFAELFAASQALSAALSFVRTGTVECDCSGRVKEPRLST